MLKKYGLIGLGAILCMCMIALGLSLQGTQVVAQTKGEICDNNIDDDGDKAIDCADADCAGDPSCKEPPPEGTLCSPGWWKNHEAEFDACCPSVGDCDALWYAITCRGSQPGCTGENRQAASNALSTTCGCFE